MPNKIYVVAGNYRQYQNFIYDDKRVYNRNHYLYVGGADQLRGISDYTLLLIGTYHRRTDISDIYNQCRFSNARLQYA